jgi:molybdopterin synthase catalytic subunit
VEVNFEYISDKSLDIVGLLAQSHDPKAGAIVLFSGDVRDNNVGKDVEYLEYEAHTSLASKMIKEILDEAIAKWNLNLAIAQHRVGKVCVGESAVVVITASPHRKEAYQANRHIIDRIKHEVPIWKCEVFTDGTKQWGNNCNCSAVTGKADKHIYETSDEKA